MPQARRPIPQPSLLLITDRTQARRPLDVIAEAAFAAGCRWLLLREKDLPRDERLTLTKRLMEVAEPYDATVLVSSDLDAAPKAHGVHLPRDGDIAAARSRLGAQALIGSSAHDLREVNDAVAAGADYVTMSPIFPSPSKPGYGPPVGPVALEAIAQAASVPVIALGGIAVDNAGTCLRAGAAGVAVMGEVMRSDDPGAEMTALLQSLEGTQGDTGRRRNQVPG